MQNTVASIKYKKDNNMASYIGEFKMAASIQYNVIIYIQSSSNSVCSVVIYIYIQFAQNFCMVNHCIKFAQKHKISTDGWTDGRTDTVNPVYPPPPHHLQWVGGIIYTCVPQLLYILVYRLYNF